MYQNQDSVIAGSTLYKRLANLADQYPLADVIETLAHITSERKLEKTAELLDSALEKLLEEGNQ